MYSQMTFVKAKNAKFFSQLFQFLYGLENPWGFFIYLFSSHERLHGLIMFSPSTGFSPLRVCDWKGIYNCSNRDVWLVWSSHSWASWIIMLIQSAFAFRTAFHYVKLQDILLGKPWTPVMSLPWNCGLRACYTASANELTFLVFYAQFAIKKWGYYFYGEVFLLHSGKKVEIIICFLKKCNFNFLHLCLCSPLGLHSFPKIC